MKLITTAYKFQNVFSDFLRRDFRMTAALRTFNPSPLTPNILHRMSTSASSHHKRRRIEESSSLPSLASLYREVSPPSLDDYPASGPVALNDTDSYPTWNLEKATRDVIDLTAEEPDMNDFNKSEFGSEHGTSTAKAKANSATQTWSSPFRLTKIRDLPDLENEDAIGIREILGDVMLREVWLFNYMHDIPWVMSQFDSDIRAHVKVVFVHGNWKQDDPARKLMEEQAKSYSNVKLVAAYLPEAFGTHHTKIMVLFRGDDVARIMVQTANMIPFDWTNMTQAAWISPLLPLVTKYPPPSAIGDQFKKDILDYFLFYGKARTGPLVNSLRKYSFSSVKAIFIGSVPGRHKMSDAKWGWPKLRKALSSIPSLSPGKTPKIFAQCSSVATLGANNTWLTPVFFSALSACATKEGKKPQFGIIFPTTQEIRDSLNGYASGSSIHIRLGSPAQQKQLTYLGPLFHRWGSSPQSPPSSSSVVSAGRDRAAPHIKTYIRFSEDPKSVDTNIDWALLTSANISTQAWGAAEKDGTVRVCSYEAGVLVHPGLWGNDVKMKPVFRKDSRNEEKVVAIRMPYGLPPGKYASQDEVWYAGKSYTEMDWMGRSWEV